MSTATGSLLPKSVSPVVTPAFEMIWPYASPMRYLGAAPT